MEGECHIMVDIETLGTRTSSMILSIAAIAFDPKTGKHLNPIFYKKVDVDSYRGMESIFTFDGDTLKWWMEQTQEARLEAFCGENRVHIKKVLEEFISWCVNISGGASIKIWAHGAPFDLPMIRRTMEQFDLSPPWKFWNERDTRTFYETMAIDFRKIGSVPVNGKILPAHNPIADCARQIEGIHIAVRKWT